LHTGRLRWPSIEESATEAAVADWALEAHDNLGDENEQRHTLEALMKATDIIPLSERNRFIRSRVLIPLLVVLTLGFTQRIHGDDRTLPAHPLSHNSNISKERGNESAQQGTGSFDLAFQKVAPAVFQVVINSSTSKGPELRPAGTAFLISRQKRLLVTAAHVADLALEGDGLSVVCNGTAITYRVVQVLYHPELYRTFDVGLTALSTDPRDGDVAHPTIDLAILHLAEGGPELPPECELASDEELRQLDRNAVASMGFPLVLGSTQPAAMPARSVNSSLGLITKFISYGEDTSVDDSIPRQDRGWFRSRLKVHPGFSGGPVFLGNGHVIGVIYADFTKLEGEPSIESVRIDRVREVLALVRNSSPVQNERQNSLNELRRAVRLVRRVNDLIKEQRYREASEGCNEAIHLVPDYSWAYFKRCEVYLHYCTNSWKSLSYEERRRFATFAAEDVQHCIATLGEPNIYVEYIQGYVNLLVGKSNEDRSMILKNIDYLDELIRDPNGQLEDWHAKIVHCRACCREALGDLEGARRDIDEAIRLEPSNPLWLLRRSAFWERRLRPDLATADKVVAENLRSKKPHEDKASLYPDSQFVHTPALSTGAIRVLPVPKKSMPSEIQDYRATCPLQRPRSANKYLVEPK
jgi:S1-C subfamily serine protease